MVHHSEKYGADHFFELLLALCSRLLVRTYRNGIIVLQISILSMLSGKMKANGSEAYIYSLDTICCVKHWIPLRLVANETK